MNSLLEQLLANLRAVLQERFCGLYLYGSLASGDFDPQRSDIDFLVVTEGFLAAETIAALGAMHAGMAASSEGRVAYWAGKLEGAYVPRQMLRRYDPQGPEVPQTNEGQFYLAALGSDWVIQYHVLRETSAAVAGPALREMIEPVTAQALREAVVQVLDEWWRPVLANESRMARSDYQAYAVLTMCRALCMLREGGMLSKSAAARWARQALEAKWRGLIDWAAAWPAEQTDRRDEVGEFIRYTLSTIR